MNTDPLDVCYKINTPRSKDGMQMSASCVENITLIT